MTLQMVLPVILKVICIFQAFNFLKFQSICLLFFETHLMEKGITIIFVFSW